MTPAERQIVSDLKDLLNERDKALQQFKIQERDLRHQLNTLQIATDIFERALMTAQSDELVHAVAKALRELGFIVTDMDQTASPRDKLEDLRIEDPNQSGWIALAEIKGYTKGAKTEALTQFLRFHARYFQSTGKQPSASWYICQSISGT